MRTAADREIRREAVIRGGGPFIKAQTEPAEEKEMFALQRQLLEEWVAEQVVAYQQDRQSERDRRLLDKSRYFDES